MGAARSRSDWGECAAQLTRLAEQLAAPASGSEDILRAAALDGIWSELLAVLQAATGTSYPPSAAQCALPALQCAAHLARAGRPLPSGQAQGTFQCALQCMLLQDTLGSAAVGSCGPVIAGQAAALASYVLNTAAADAVLRLRGQGDADTANTHACIAQLCVQGYAAHCAVGTHADTPPSTPLRLPPPAGEHSGAGTKDDAHTGSTIVYPAGDAAALTNNPDTPRSAAPFVQLLLGLVRCSDLPLLLLARSGAVQVLLHAASKREDDHETSVAALGAVRSLVQIALPRHPAAPPIAKEHRLRMARSSEAGQADDAAEIATHLLRAEAPQVAASLAQRHRNVWVRRAATECLETFMYTPSLVGSGGVPPVQDTRPTVLCSAAPCRDSALQHSLGWVEWATGAGQHCEQIAEGHPSGSLVAAPSQQQLDRADGEYCAAVMKAAADADWLSSKWAKRALAFWRRAGPEARQ